MPALFDSLAIGELHIPNRIIMAPLTRSRAGVVRIPNALMAQYYAQRASAGLILSEATVVSPMGIGYADTPGIWSDEQVEGWKLTTRAVHEAGGRIFLQLWHVGRISHPTFLNGELPVAPSAITPNGRVSLLRPATAYVQPRALARAEIPQILAAVRKGAQNAQRAGFDGVELHAANGYLFDQFLQDSSNIRHDDYGGAIENRARLLLEATDELISVWGAGRVGVHLAPRGDSNSIGDSNRAATFGYVARELGHRRIAFIMAREYVGPDSIGPQLKQLFGGVYIANERFTRASAQQAVADGSADAVAFGKLYISNPDLVERFSTNAPLNEFVTTTFYAGGATGYTDYPALSAEQAPLQAMAADDQKPQASATASRQ
jgi:2,4-dienoyl-CoA reductase-like NADH-dependent reductase (Old Yellow Enzyme family)